MHVHMDGHMDISTVRAVIVTFCWVCNDISLMRPKVRLL